MAQETPSSTSTPPQLGSYEILREIRRDSFGIIYAAKQKHDGDPVLLRALAPEITNSENFIVRFELLRRILTRLAHPHILTYQELGVDQNIHFIAQHYPGPIEEAPRTMQDFDIKETPNRYRTLYRLLEGIARGLQGLEEFRNHYFTEGILHDALRPDTVYLDFEKSLIGGVAHPYPKLGAVAESFLFFGDSPSSRLKYRLNPYIKELRGDLYAQEYLLPPQLRHSETKPPWLHLYSFGALCYHSLTGRSPRGRFPSVSESNPHLDSSWDTLIHNCLAAPFEGSWRSMKGPLDELHKIGARFSDASPEERRLQELPIPAGMSLVLFHDKVELGSAEGPLIEQPRFRARIKPFLIDTAPVSCSQFAEFLPSYKSSPFSKSPAHPATMVSWHMAKAYCQWRCEKEGVAPDTYRLPTEYEWEAACRGTEGELYPWGAAPDAKRMHCGLSSDSGALPVKSLPPGRFGLYSMLGNVWEWTDSAFKGHPFSKHHEPGYDSDLMTVKGGCWVTPTKQCRASLRAAFSPNERRGNVGFRCVRMANQEGNQG